MRKKLWFLWSVFIDAIVIYLVLAYFLVSSNTSNPDFVPIVAMVTILLSIISAMISILIRLKLLTGPIQNGALDIHSEQGFQKYQTISIVNWALSESVAVFGLILVIISGNFYYAIPYCVISLILLILHRPSLGGASE
ncbi:MAG: hypothetical protein JXR73_15050 [Candidatus Omnitrophica bacterium]|nr:hypothetical protein [Candidatus Omnitrophota bacterium]